MAEPRLDVFTGRAGMVAWRQAILVDGPFSPPGARFVEQAGPNIESDGKRLGLYNGIRVHLKVPLDNGSAFVSIFPSILTRTIGIRYPPASS
jgi:hypothetical protein